MAVAIIGIVAAIAIPAYSGYIKQAKVTTLLEHITNAVRVVKSEAAKIAAGSAGEDVIAQLNLGNKSAISNPAVAAFVAGTTPLPGQVAIAGLDGQGRPVSGMPITVRAGPVDGTVPSDYPVPLQITFTPE